MPNGSVVIIIIVVESKTRKTPSTLSDRQHRRQKRVDMYEIADGVVKDTVRIVRVPALVIALESEMASRGLPSQRALLELDCVDKVEVMKATTPADFELAAVAHPRALATLKHWFNRVTVRDLSDERQVACALSHMRAWAHCAESDTPLLIAEDDVCTHRAQLLQNQVALSRVPNDAHMLSLLNLSGDFARGFVVNALQAPTEVTEIRKEFSGLQCYLLRPDGARLLLQHAMPLTMHIDRYISDCTYAGFRLYRCGRSSIAYAPGSSTLSHSPSIAWTLIFVSGSVIVLLLATCATLAFQLVARGKEARAPLALALGR